MMEYCKCRYYNVPPPPPKVEALYQQNYPTTFSQTGILPPSTRRKNTLSNAKAAFTTKSIRSQYFEYVYHNGKALNPDIWIEVQNELIGAHKLFIAYKSSYFAKLFTRNYDSSGFKSNKPQQVANNDNGQNSTATAKRVRKNIETFRLPDDLHVSIDDFQDFIRLIYNDPSFGNHYSATTSDDNCYGHGEDDMEDILSGVGGSGDLQMSMLNTNTVVTPQLATPGMTSSVTRPSSKMTPFFSPSETNLPLEGDTIHDLITLDNVQDLKHSCELFEFPDGIVACDDFITKAAHDQRKKSCVASRGGSPTSLGAKRNRIGSVAFSVVFDDSLGGDKRDVPLSAIQSTSGKGDGTISPNKCLMTDYVASLWDNRVNLGDVKVVAGGVEFMAHKLVLTCHSTYFTSLFKRAIPPQITKLLQPPTSYSLRNASFQSTNPFAETTCKNEESIMMNAMRTVYLPPQIPISANTFGTILKYMYTSQLELTPTNASRIRDAANFLGMSHLVNVIDQCYPKGINPMEPINNNKPRMPNIPGSYVHQPSGQAFRPQASLPFITNQNISNLPSIFNFGSGDMGGYHISQQSSGATQLYNNNNQSTMVKGHEKAFFLPHALELSLPTNYVLNQQNFTNYNSNSPNLYKPTGDVVYPPANLYIATSNMTCGGLSSDFANKEFFEVQSILSNDYLVARNEYEVFKAAVNWLTHRPYLNDQISRYRVENYLIPIMQCIRFQLFTRQQLAQAAKLTWNWFSQNQIYRNMIVGANWYLMNLESNVNQELTSSVKKRYFIPPQAA